jgi:hypothetical protein
MQDPFFAEILHVISFSDLFILYPTGLGCVGEAALMRG